MKNRFKQLRKTLNLTQTEMGEKLGKKLRIIAYYESGERNIDDGVLFRLEKEFNVNPDWMKTGNGAMFNSAPSPDAVYIREDSHEYGDRTVCVPYYTDVKASAGYGAPVLSEEHEDYCVDKLAAKKSKHCTIISVTGDSMSPLLLNKDMILVDMDAEKLAKLRKKRIYVLRMGDTIFVKRFVRSDGAIHIFSSENRAYGDIQLDLSDDRNALIGLVKSIVYRDMEL